MNYPVVITAIGSDQTIVVHSESQLKEEVLNFIQENFPIQDIEIYELGMKHKPALMFVSTPFPTREL